MTDERSQPRYLNEPLEPKRSGGDFGGDRFQGRERSERPDEERSSSPRYGDEREYSFDDNGGRERSSNGSYGQQGQRSTREDVDRNGRSQGDSRGQRSSRGSSSTSGQAHYGGRSSYLSSRPEDRDQNRGGFSNSSQQHSSTGVGGSTFSGSKSHGPYAGKGPKGYKRSDQQICEEANQALERDSRVDASEIEVSCTGGVLKLTGKVENRAAKRDAEECVESVYGVSDVMNELKVENGFFANLLGLGSNSDSSNHANTSKSSNKPIQKNV